MAPGPPNPLLPAFLAAAENVATTRPEVDLEVARELMSEAATMLYDGLALEGLDDHDTSVAVEALARALVAPDPAVAVRERAEAVLAEDGLHEPQVVSGALLVAASILRL